MHALTWYTESSAIGLNIICSCNLPAQIGNTWLPREWCARCHTIQFHSTGRETCQTACIPCSSMYLKRLKCRTRRKWLPNVQSKRIISNILGEAVPLRLTTAALRCRSASYCNNRSSLSKCPLLDSGGLLQTKSADIKRNISPALLVSRNIDKAGGLDPYLKRIKGSKEDSQLAEALRQRIREQVEGRRLALEIAAQV